MDPVTRGAPGPGAGQAPIPETVVLRGAQTLPRARYFELEKAGMSLLDCQDLSLPEKIFGLYLLVADASRGQPAPRSLEELIPAARGGSTQRDDSKARLVLSLFTSSLALWGGKNRPQPGFGLMFSLLSGIAKQVAGFGSLQVPHWPAPVSVASVQAMSLGTIQAEADREFEEFFREQVAAGWMLRYGSLFRGASLMLIALGLGQWFIRASAVAAGRKVPVTEDIDLAIEALQREMVEASPGFKLVLEGTVSQFFDALLDRPNVAAAIGFLGR